jgi:cobalt-zinc-cadmium efflux system membrane fusion protein
MVLLLTGLVLISAAASCGRSATKEPAKSVLAQSAKDDEDQRDHAAGPAGNGLETEQSPDTSDLDRPVEELFALTCEHEKKMFECDECRYEVGVARAPASLFAGGLLKTEKAERQRVEFPLRLTGEVQFDERRVAHLSTPADGVVRQAHVALGERVKRGQVLIEIESVTVGEAEGAYLEAQAVLRLARRNHQRVVELRAEGIAAEKELLQAQQEFESAEIRAAATQGVLTRLGMSAADVKTLSQASTRGRLVLHAPADGVVLFLHAVPGEMAKTGEALATIGDTSTLWVWCDLYERDLARISRTHLAHNLSATVAVKAYPGEKFPGTVDLVSPAMQEASRTVRLRVRVSNPGGRLLAGMFADVNVFLPGEEKALALPKSAVLDDEERSFVFVHHHGDYYVRRPVTAGRAWGDRVEIVRGLRGGESVVADGSFLMKSDVLRSKMGAGCAD